MARWGWAADMARWGWAGRRVGARWKRVLDDPRVAPVMLAGAYLAIGATGVVGLLWPHTLNTDTRFYYPSAAGALLALLGGASGALAAWRGLWWMERGSISCMVGAIVCRVYSLVFQATHGTQAQGEVLISVSFLTAIVLGLLVRTLYIRGLALNPRM